MAYNPFNIFRRNQKAIFAVITVFIMFTFVLSSGLGGGADFFDWLPRWLGSKSQKGDALFTLDGSKVYARDLSDLNDQRVIANQYMSGLAAQVLEAGPRIIAADLPGVSSAHKQTLNEGQSILESIVRGTQPSVRDVGFVMSQLQELAAGKAKDAKDDDQRVARRLVSLINLGQQRMEAARAGMPNLFFTNAPNRTDRDRADFLLWVKKAEQLGIRFTPEYALRLRNVELGVPPDAKETGFNDAPVREDLRRLPRYSLDNLLKALAQEFAVRAAQTAVLGPSMAPASAAGDAVVSLTNPSPVSFVPPYELFEFYKDKTSPVTYAAIAVPAANYLSQVTATPTPEQLKELYALHKGDEPSPSLDRPGFKEPRKVKLEWVGATGTEPFYTQAAEYLLKTGEVQAAVGHLLTVPVAPVGPAWAATAVAPLTLQDPLLQKGYQDEVVSKHDQNLRFNWSSSSFLFDALDTSVVQPGNLASAAGGVAGALLTHGSPAGAAALFNQAVVAQEKKARIAAGLAVPLAGVPTPAVGMNILAAAAAQQAGQPKPLPLAAVKADLQKKLAEQTAKKFLQTDFENFQAELAKLTDKGKAKDKTPAREYIEKFLKDRGIKHGGPTEFRDEYAVEDDPALAPLKEAMGKGAHGTAPVQFGKRFYWTKALTPQVRAMVLSQFGLPPNATLPDDLLMSVIPPQLADQLPLVPAEGVYAAEFYPNQRGGVSGTDPQYLVWRTEEKKANEVLFENAKQKVEEAWKRLEARKLAKAAADKLAAQVKAFDVNDGYLVEQKMRDLYFDYRNSFTDQKDRDRARFITLDRVAPLTVAPPDFTGRTAGGGLQPYQLAPSADLPYPPDGMAAALLEGRKNPVKHTEVLPAPKKDAPAGKPKYDPDVYYVTTVVGKQEALVDQFGRQVYGATASPTRTAVVGAQMQETARKTYDATLALLKSEFKYANESAKLDDDKRANLD